MPSESNFGVANVTNKKCESNKKLATQLSDAS